MDEVDRKRKVQNEFGTRNQQKYEDDTDYAVQ
jgi:hypothetical protein